MKRDRFRKKISEWDLEGINESLFQTALMHPSYDSSKHRSNQRLEFLGDAVLGLILANHLFEKNPQCNEGELTRMRANLAQESTLAQVAMEIGLGEILLLGKGEEKDGGRMRPSTLADAMEAVIASIYLSFGMEKAAAFVLKNFGAMEERLAAAERQITDYKTALQEYAQSLGSENVHYEILSEDGPPHQRIFSAGVYYLGELWGEGKGRSKKEAEKAAAEIAYHAMAARFAKDHHGKA
ncbi:MAG: ribonuclease III [Bacillota bacterium]|nr:ribonuclease III [Bacillota bacterium]